MCRTILHANKMLLSMEMFFRHTKVWFSNNHQLYPVESMGAVAVKEEG